ncbi:MAG: hypothetical protein ABI471_01915 [Sphingomonas bacterium]
MSEVWISGILSDHRIGNKQGLRWKYPAEDWTSANHIVDKEVVSDLARRGELYVSGYRLPDEDVPEAGAIWDPRCFAGTGDLFMVGHMYAVKPRLAEVLSRFDLGEGGLSPVTIWQSDLQTPAPGEYWLLHLGARKDSFLAEQSNQENYRVRHFSDDPETGLPRWKTSPGMQDGDVAVSQAALEGADLWVEARMWHKLFMSGALADALNETKLKKVDFRLKQCRVVGG